MMHLSFMSFILLLIMGTTLHVNGATNTLANANNSQTPRCNKAPVNHCNCQCTLNQDSRAIKSLEAKVEGLIGLNNNTCKISDAVNSLEAKVVSLNVLNNKTYDISDAVQSLETKMESLIGLKNKTSDISDAVKSLEAKFESISGLNNGTSTIRDGLNSLEEKVESLIGLISRNSTFIPEAASKPKDRWQKLNRSPVCFGAKGDQFGNFTAPARRLAAIKLVYLYGYVSCCTPVISYWSYWGCGDNPTNGKNTQINVVITDSSNQILLPPDQFIGDANSKWYKIPGYNSLSPELVLSVFGRPVRLLSSQVLRLWYGEDMVNVSERDNGGRVCADVYSIFI